MRNTIALVLAVLLASHAALADTAQQQYDRSAVGFDEAVVADHHVLAQVMLPYQGKYKQPLSMPDFFRAVDRKDLADEYDSRVDEKLGLLLAGGSVALGSLDLTALYASNNTCALDDPNFIGCANSRSTVTTAIFGVGSVVGLGLAIGSLFINPNPVDAPTLRELADKHNQDLRATLGLTALAGPGEAGMALKGEF